MYAIVDIAGQQFKVEKGKKYYVHRLPQEEGVQVDFENVLLLEDDKGVKVGTPTVEGVKIKSAVVQHLKGDKVIVFKKKRRKGHQKQNGHRQYLTQIEILDILGGSEVVEKTEKTAVKKEAVSEVKEQTKEKASVVTKDNSDTQEKKVTAKPESVAKESSKEVVAEVKKEEVKKVVEDKVEEVKGDTLSKEETKTSEKDSNPESESKE